MKSFLADLRSDDMIANSCNDNFINRTDFINQIVAIHESATVSVMTTIKEKLFPKCNLGKLS